MSSTSTAIWEQPGYKPDKPPLSPGEPGYVYNVGTGANVPGTTIPEGSTPGLYGVTPVKAGEVPSPQSQRIAESQSAPHVLAAPPSAPSVQNAFVIKVASPQVSELEEQVRARGGTIESENVVENVHVLGTGPGGRTPFNVYEVRFNLPSDKAEFRLTDIDVTATQLQQYTAGKAVAKMSETEKELRAVGALALPIGKDALASIIRTGSPDEAAAMPTLYAQKIAQDYPKGTSRTDIFKAEYIKAAAESPIGQVGQAAALGLVGGAVITKLPQAAQLAIGGAGLLVYGAGEAQKYQMLTASGASPERIKAEALVDVVSLGVGIGAFKAGAKWAQQPGISISKTKAESMEWQGERGGDIYGKSQAISKGSGKKAVSEYTGEYKTLIEQPGSTRTAAVYEIETRGGGKVTTKQIGADIKIFHKGTEYAVVGRTTEGEVLTGTYYPIATKNAPGFVMREALGSKDIKIVETSMGSRMLIKGRSLLVGDKYINVDTASIVAFGRATSGEGASTVSQPSGILSRIGASSSFKATAAGGKISGQAAISKGAEAGGITLIGSQLAAKAAAASLVTKQAKYPIMLSTPAAQVKTKQLTTTVQASKVAQKQIQITGLKVPTEEKPRRGQAAVSGATQEYLTGTAVLPAQAQLPAQQQVTELVQVPAMAPAAGMPSLGFGGAGVPQPTGFPAMRIPGLDVPFFGKRKPGAKKARGRYWEHNIPLASARTVINMFGSPSKRRARKGRFKKPSRKTSSIGKRLFG